MPSKKTADDKNASTRTGIPTARTEQMEAFLAKSFTSETEFLKANKPRTERMRWATLGLRHNLTQIRWAWENPGKAYDHVSVPLQQVMTFLALVSLFPLEEMMYDLADDELSTRRIPAWIAADLQMDNPEGFLAHLPQWRRAVALSRVEVYLELRGHQIAGLRAWLPPYEDVPAWKMEMDITQMASLVKCLLEILPAWGETPLRIKLPKVQTAE